MTGRFDKSGEHQPKMRLVDPCSVELIAAGGLFELFWKFPAEIRALGVGLGYALANSVFGGAAPML